ncbi:hypothetical protein SEA_OCTOBIEN14_75 [Gordonia phage Octobien14]|uniref:Uncharacterized protein n=1 Tax=Gordonia phage Octobien14 TaxID=2483673 RepID=A0A3G3M9U9_9CAUD|nr:hypothetical protein L3Y22_gp075 [Gordonia phage Octobien14]AYR03282.1 hypothetical protein SEA_OCTOBIEN14_75 [Gordonia phage Octobien14]
MTGSVATFHPSAFRGPGSSSKRCGAVRRGSLVVPHIAPKYQA